MNIRRSDKGLYQEHSEVNLQRILHKSIQHVPKVKLLVYIHNNQYIDSFWGAQDPPASSKSLGMNINLS